MQFKAGRLALKVATIYVVVAACWISFSDRVLAWFVDDPVRLVELATLKGLGFVLATGVLLHQMLSRWLRRWELEATRRRHAEETMRQSEDRYQALFERSLDCVYLHDFEGRFLDANQAALNLLGYRREDISGLTFASLLTEDQVPMALRSLEEIKATGHQAHPTEFRLRGKDGREVFVETQSSLIYHDGKPQAIQGIGRDITRRKQAEAAVRVAGRFAQSTIDALSEHLCVLDEDGVILATNRAWKNFGNELSDTQFARRVQPPVNYLAVCDAATGAEAADAAAFAAGIRAVLRGEREVFVMEYPCHFASQQRWFLGRVTRFPDSAVARVVVVHEDITERKLAELLNVRLATAVEQAAETIVVTDPDGMILYANPAFERTTGYTRAEALGQNPRILKSGHHDAEFYRRMWAALKRGEVWAGRFSNRRKDGQLYEEEATISPVRDAAGQIISYVAVKRDVTRELELEAQVRQSQKMEAIGTLAGGIAHDFNNILTAMFGYAHLLQMDLAGKPEALEKVEELLKSAGRAKDLVHQILTFSRQREQKRQVIPLDTVVREATKFLRASLPASLKVEFHLDENVPTVLADPTQVYQVTMNLATNALHAMEGRGGRLTVSLESFQPDAAFIETHPEFQAIRYARLTVSDTGYGMEARTLDRIFEPFFTTKPAGQGTGLGLAVVHGIVKGHEGQIQVESQPGQGTTFRVYFPEHLGVAPLSDQTNDRVAGGQGQRILMVDDETSLASMFRVLLKLLNYEPSVHTCVHEALAEFAKNPARFDLVITDLTMPDASGLEVARQIRVRRPDLPVLLLTGFSSNLNQAELLAAGVTELLEKPVSLNTLAVAVHNALSRTATPAGRMADLTAVPTIQAPGLIAARQLQMADGCL